MAFAVPGSSNSFRASTTRRRVRSSCSSELCFIMHGSNSNTNSNKIKNFEIIIVVIIRNNTTNHAMIIALLPSRRLERARFTRMLARDASLSALSALQPSSRTSASLSLAKGPSNKKADRSTWKHYTMHHILLLLLLLLLLLEYIVITIIPTTFFNHVLVYYMYIT